MKQYHQSTLLVYDKYLKMSDKTNLKIGRGTETPRNLLECIMCLSRSIWYVIIVSNKIRICMSIPLVVTVVATFTLGL